MKDSAEILVSSANGLYAAPESITALKQAALARGLAWMEIDLTGVVDKAAFLVRCQKALGLPPAFGHNWDAFADSLKDLVGQPAQGYVVFGHSGGDFARLAPQDFAVALEILSSAAAYWLAKNKVFLVLLDADTRGGRKLKGMPAH